MPAGCRLNDLCLVKKSQEVNRVWLFHATFEYSFTSFSRRSPSSSAVTSRSYWACKPSQNSEDIPKNHANLRAVSAVILLFSSTISFILRGGTPKFNASLFWLKPIGFKNSSRRTSPRCMGCNFFFFMSSLLSDNRLFLLRMHHCLSRENRCATGY